MALDRHHEQANARVSLGDLVVVLLAGVLSSLSERLRSDGFESQAELVADLAETIDDYVTIGAMEGMDG